MKKTLTLYSFSTRRDSETAAIQNIGLDKDAVEREHKSSKEGEGLTGEIETSKHFSDSYEVPVGTPFISFIYDGAVKVGERHVDARCTGIKSFYTTNELLEQATEAFTKARKMQSARADSYYSQPWV